MFTEPGRCETPRIFVYLYREQKSIIFFEPLRLRNPGGFAIFALEVVMCLEEQAFLFIFHWYNVGLTDRLRCETWPVLFFAVLRRFKAFLFRIG